MVGLKCVVFCVVLLLCVSEVHGTAGIMDILFPQTEFHIKGRFTCGGKPLYGQTKVRVELREKDLMPGSDDVLAADYADADGLYDFAGNEREIFGAEPYLWIFHKCGGSCRRIKITGDFINPGKYELKNRGAASDICETAKYPAQSRLI